MNSEDVRHTLSAEGADPLLLAGVNEANFAEIQRAIGVRISQRGDALTLVGTVAQIERATPVVQGFIDLARAGQPIEPEDVYRLASDGHVAEIATSGDAQKIVIPGMRRAIVAKTAGQRE